MAPRSRRATHASSSPSGVTPLRDFTLPDSVENELTQPAGREATWAAASSWVSGASAAAVTLQILTLPGANSIASRCGTGVPAATEGAVRVL